MEEMKVIPGGKIEVGKVEKEVEEVVKLKKEHKGLFARKSVNVKLSRNK